MTSLNTKPDAADINDFLQRHQRKNQLSCITCGGVGSGKSTLIGHLLTESDALADDQLATLQADPHKWGSQGGNTDFALLLDSLNAEREQGTTIEVAYRFFATEQRKFIVADTPGLEQYTRNMIGAASTADVAVIVVDATKGLQSQTRRHSYLVSLLGVQNIVLAVNKMDLVDYTQEVYQEIVDSYAKFASATEVENFTAIPVSALNGDNLIEPSTAMPWYHGATLLSYLETVKVDQDAAQQKPLRMPVQLVSSLKSESNTKFRGYAGTLSSGTVKPGDTIRIQPSGQQSSIAKIITQDGELALAVAGQAITLVLNDDIEISRGDIISTNEAPASSADQFECTIVWMDAEKMLPGRPYLLKIGTQTVTASITDIKHEVNVNTLEHIAAKSLKLNTIGVCNLSTDRQIAFDPYRENPHTGAFILIDKLSNKTVGAGMLHFALRRSDNIHMQAVDVNKKMRSELKGQKACVLWFTGLSGSGKSTVANLVEKKLASMGKHTYLLDGDNIRHGLNKDLGFTDVDRVENIRRIGEVARLMVDSGLIVLTAFISPFRSERQMARAQVDSDEFLEVFIDTPLAVAEERDPKGLYKKARRGELKNFTGIDSPYEVPENAEIMLDTSTMSAEQAAAQVITDLCQRGIIEEQAP